MLGHGHAPRGKPSRTYTAWQNMKKRCYDTTFKHYKNYGGRGIRICDSWFTFENFLADMGIVPEFMELERKDNNKDYCKDNCIYTFREENVRNRRSSIFVQYKGEQIYLKDLADKSDVNYRALHKLIITKGVNPEQAVSRLQDTQLYPPSSKRLCNP